MRNSKVHLIQLWTLLVAGGLLVLPHTAEARHSRGRQVSANANRVVRAIPGQPKPGPVVQPIRGKGGTSYFYLQPQQTKRGVRYRRTSSIWVPAGGKVAIESTTERSTFMGPKTVVRRTVARFRENKRTGARTVVLSSGGATHYQMYSGSVDRNKEQKGSGEVVAKIDSRGNVQLDLGSLYGTHRLKLPKQKLNNADLLRFLKAKAQDIENNMSRGRY